jgi:hypothetical protein
LRAPVTVERVKFRGQLMNGDLPHTYLDGNIVSVQEQLIRNVSLIKGNSGESLIVIYSTHYADKGILCQRIMMLTVSVKEFLTFLTENKISGLLVT